MTVILDPTAEGAPIPRQLSRIPSDGIRSIALLDISKPKGDVFLDRLEEGLKKRIEGAEITRYRKPAFTKPAPQDLRSRIARNHQLVILALAD